MAGDMDHLDQLEQPSVHILREAYANFKNLCMLWSIGKDSTVLLWLARKAFFGHVPFPLVHIDTAYKIPEMIEYRDRLADGVRTCTMIVRAEPGRRSSEKQTFPGRRGRPDHLLQAAQDRGAEAHAQRRVAAHTGSTTPSSATRLDTNTEPFTGVIVGRPRRRGRLPLEGALLLAA